MKTKNLIKIALSALIVLGAFTSCVNDSDFDTPQVQEEDNNIGNSNISAVQDAINQQFVAGNPASLKFTFPDDSPIIVPAYVVSDDTGGNFYKKLIVQDMASNPTAGLEIMIDQGSLHTTYNTGRKIYIKMAGLTVEYIDGQTSSPGFVNASDPTDATPGVYKIGIQGTDRLDRIPSIMLQNYIVRSSTTEAIVPSVITPADFDDAHMNTYIQMNNTQVAIGDLGKTFAGEAGDSYDATRTLLNCDSEVEFGLMTSTFSNFKSMVMPEGKGTLKAVLMKNYRERAVVTVLNSYADVDFPSTDRCGYGLLDCTGGALSASATTLFSEDFESYATNTTAYPSWTAINVNGGARLFRNRSYSGNKYSEASAYGSGEDPMEVWLVTPAIDLDTTANEVLTFKTKAHHDNGSVLTVLVSTDFTGDVATATWLATDATIGTASSIYGNWTNSGDINLSCLTGNVYIAFVYKGADGGITTGMQLDDVMVKGE
jgi:hypothetical protein